MQPTLSEFESLAGDAFDRVVTGLDSQTLERLNLGVAVSPDTNAQRDADGSVSFILGTFSNHPVLGRQVELYYGSFLEVHRSLQPWDWQDEIEAGVRHELRHFVEDLQGRRDLAIEEEEERRFQRLLRPAARPADWRDAARALAKPALALVVFLILAFFFARSLTG